MSSSHLPSISATELAKLGTCEVRLRLDAVYGKGQETADIAVNKARGSVVHEKALEAAVKHGDGRDSRCFIATAVYGHAAPETDTLRVWRDTVLMTYPFGKAFIRAYYTFSPPIARSLVRHQRAADLIRRILDRFVVLIATSKTG